MNHEAGKRATVATQRRVRRLKVLLQQQIANRIDRVLAAHAASTATERPS
jgi:hypothetical protein